MKIDGLAEMYLTHGGENCVTAACKSEKLADVAYLDRDSSSEEDKDK